MSNPSNEGLGYFLLALCCVKLYSTATGFVVLRTLGVRPAPEKFSMSPLFEKLEPVIRRNREIERFDGRSFGGDELSSGSRNWPRKGPPLEELVGIHDTYRKLTGEIGRPGSLDPGRGRSMT